MKDNFSTRAASKMPIVDFIRDRFAFHHEKRFFIANEIQRLFEELALRASARVSEHPVFKGTRFLPQLTITGEGENAVYDIHLMMCSYGRKRGTLVSQSSIAHICVQGATLMIEAGAVKDGSDLFYMGVLPQRWNDYQRLKTDIRTNAQAKIDRAVSFAINLGHYLYAPSQRNPL